MKLWPGSLVGRNALVIVTVMLLAQVGSALIVRNLIIRPRVEQIAEAVVRNVAAVRAGLTVLPAEQRIAFLDAFRQRSSGAPAAAADEPSSRLVAALLSPIEQAFVRSVSIRLAAEDTDVIWRRDADRGLALRLRIGDDAYWLPLPGVLPSRELTGAWLAASAIAALLAVGAALAIQHRIDEPLRALVAATARLGTGARPERLPEDGPAEIASVGRSFNQLVQRLAATDRERALMLAGVSHDLRTPLTKLRLGVEIMGDAAEPALAASMNRSIAEMDRLVGQFLDFARGDDGSLPTGPVALDALAIEIAASFADHGQDGAARSRAGAATGAARGERAPGDRQPGRERVPARRRAGGSAHRPRRRVRVDRSGRCRARHCACGIRGHEATVPPCRSGSRRQRRCRPRPGHRGTRGTRARRPARADGGVAAWAAGAAGIAFRRGRLIFGSARRVPTLPACAAGSRAGPADDPRCSFRPE